MALVGKTFFDGHLIAGFSGAVYSPTTIRDLLDKLTLKCNFCHLLEGTSVKQSLFTSNYAFNINGLRFHSGSSMRRLWGDYLNGYTRRFFKKGPTSCSWQQMKPGPSSRKIRRVAGNDRLLLLEGELSNGIQKLFPKTCGFHPKTNNYRQYLHTFRDVRPSYIVIVLPCKYIG